MSGRCLHPDHYLREWQGRPLIMAWRNLVHAHDSDRGSAVCPGMVVTRRSGGKALSPSGFDLRVKAHCARAWQNRIVDVIRFGSLFCLHALRKPNVTQCPWWQQGDIYKQTDRMAGGARPRADCAFQSNLHPCPHTSTKATTCQSNQALNSVGNCKPLRHTVPHHGVLHARPRILL